MKNLIIIFLGFTFLYSCIKNNDPLTENTPGVKVIDKTITNAMYFKKGSYWIYESDKGEIDSMWIDSKSSIIINRDDKTQYFNTYLYSSIEQNSRVITVMYWNSSKPDTQIRISIKSYFRGIQGSLISADIFKPAQGTNNSCVTCKGDTAILMPSYTVKGKEYKNVWRFLSKDLIRNYPNSIYLDSVGYYFFAENIGIIQKFENIGGSPNHFKIVRYHIEK